MDDDTTGVWIAALKDALDLAGLASSVVEDPSAHAMSSLVVDLPIGEDGLTKAVALAFLDIGPANSQFRLLQAWIDLGPAQEQDIVALAAANAPTPIGHAGLRDGALYFRHVWPLPNSVYLTPGLIEEWLGLFLYSATVVITQLRALA